MPRLPSFYASFLTFTLCSLGMAAAVGVLPVAAAESRPHVLMIAVDDLNCSLGCYGDPVARTPHIDRLAASGTSFLNAYCQLPLCNPTRASLMTGLRPDTIAVYDLDRHFRESRPNAVTIPQALRKVGYRTARVGKIFHYNVPAGIGTNGLDDAPSWDIRINPAGRDTREEDRVTNAEPHRKISAALSWLQADGTAEEQTDGLIATRAIELLREQQRDRPTQPLFLAVGFFRPHTPYIAPRSYFERIPLDSIRLPFSPTGDRDDIPTAAFAHNNPVPNYGLAGPVLRQATQAYHASVAMVDDQVGRLLSELESLGLREHTIVVLWSDHGYHLGEHGGIWQKRTLFEQSARAPLLIDAPGYQPGTTRRIVEFVDVFPTIADLTSAPVPAELAGRSLVPLLEDPARSWEGVAVTQVLRPADDRLDAPVMGRSVRTSRWRYTEWNGGEAGRELYDHAADPQEFENLLSGAKSRPKPITEVVGRLRKELDTRAQPQPPETGFNPARL